MNTARFNRQRCLLPTTLIAKHVNDMFTDIIEDSGLTRLYSRPLDCLQETLLGVDAPGINLQLLEQTKWSANHATSKKQFFPRNANNAMTRPDDEISLRFRHIDGFHNYWMLYYSLNYSQNHLQQSRNNETFIELGSLTIDYIVSKNYKVRTVYKGLVYESIEGFSSDFAQEPTPQQFSVNLKFTGYTSDLYKNDTKVLTAQNFAIDSNSALTLTDLEQQAENYDEYWRSKLTD